MRYPIRAISLGLLALAASLPEPRCQAQTLKDLFPELAILASAPGTGTGSGISVALSGDTVAVGSPFDTVGSNYAQGCVRVFVRSGSGWMLQATITAADGAAGDQFGRSLALIGDRLVVGVPEDTVGANASQGSVRVFTRSGSTWTPAANIYDSTGGRPGDQFGFSIAMSGDDLAIGAPYKTVGTNAGQGVVYHLEGISTSWTFDWILKAADGAEGDYFGYSVSMAENTLAVGVPGDDTPDFSVTDAGTVRVFLKMSNGYWMPQGTLWDAVSEAGQSFGMAVSLSGNTLAIGVPFESANGLYRVGSARVYVRSASIWLLQAKLVPTGINSDVSDVYFGSALSLSGDRLAIGARGDRVGANHGAGSVRMYGRIGTTWSALASLTASNDDVVGSLGYCVALEGETLVAGAPYDDVGSSYDQGAAHVFGNYRVYNDTRNAGYGSLGDAIAGSYAGDRLLVGAAAFAEAGGIVDSSTKRFSFVELEPLALPSSTLMSLASGTVFEKSPAVAMTGLAVGGKLVAPSSGTLTFEHLSVANSGQFLQRGSTVLVNQAMTTSAGGACYLQGPVLAETVSTEVGGQNRVAGDTDVFANYVNAGSTVIQRGILYIYGSLTNTGTMSGEYDTGFLPPNPGDGCSIGGDYVVSADSSIVLPGDVWWLRVGGNFDVAIDDPSRFTMDRSTLELTGLSPGAQQTVEAMGANMGADEDGFDATNFPIGAVRVRAGATVRLVDAHDNAPGAGAESIYTQGLYVPAGATLVTNGHRIYAREATIAGTVSNPDDIVVIPGAPPCIADLYQDGIVNGADLAALLSAWGACPPGTCRADLTGDGQVNGADLASLLSAWGPCP